MPTGFTATEFSVVCNSGVLVTTLATTSTETDDFYLMLQHKRACDAQDFKFGMHLPYIEYCGQGNSWYGHILLFVLRRDRISVQMDAEAADWLKSDGEIEVKFSLDSAELRELRLAILETFNGYAYFRDET